MKNKKNVPNIHAWITEITNDPTAPRKATASIQIGNLLYVRGIGIYSSGEEHYIVLPKHEETAEDGTKRLASSVESGSHEMRKAINDAVMDAYSQALARFAPGNGSDGSLPFDL